MSDGRENDRRPDTNRKTEIMRVEQTDISPDVKKISPHTLDAILEVVKNTETRWLDKNKLIKQHMKAFIEKQKYELQRAVEFEKEKIDSTKDLATREMRIYHHEISMIQQSHFLDILKKMNSVVVNKHISYLETFAEELTEHEERIINNNAIKQDFKNKILESISKKFNQVYERLEIMTEDFLVAMKEKQKIAEEIEARNKK